MIKKLIIVYTLSLCSSLADIISHIIEDKFWLQTGEENTTFLGGGLFFEFNDGFYVENPNPLIPPDALVLEGDVDGDGVTDAFQVLSLISVANTTQLAPFQRDRVRLISGPPSDLPRPSAGFTDYSFSVQWDYDDPQTLRELTLAGYRSARAFTAGSSERSAMDRMVVPGVYTFELPVYQGAPSARHYRNLEVTDIPEAYPGRVQAALPQGFRFTNRLNAAGMIELDPRVSTDLTWTGIDFTTILTNDRVGLSFFNTQRAVINRVTGVEVLDPVIITGVGFPFPTIFLGPDKYRGVYRIPPSILTPVDLSVPTTVFAELRIERGDFGAAPYPSGYLATRSLQVRLQLVDTYAGFAFGLTRFDPGEDRTPGADPDGDGFSNLIEFAMGSDPSDAVSIPGVAPSDIGVTPGSFEVTPLGDGRCNVSLTKRPNVGNGLAYFIEHSEDMVTWTRVPMGGNADWVENTNDATTLQVTSVASIVPTLATGCFFRVAVVLN